MINNLGKTKVEITTRGWLYLADQSYQKALSAADPSKEESFQHDTQHLISMALESLKTNASRSTKSAQNLSSKVIFCKSADKVDILYTQGTGN